MSTDAPLRTEGSRPDLVATLNERAEAWWHMGNSKADAARAGAQRLEAGDSSIRVGLTLYVVTGE